jgi:FixJ family two-component response regulator
MRTVLVIDDEKPTLTMFSLLLEAMGYNTLTAASGAEGLEVFARERPRVVFTDVKMPDMDGLEILARIKALAPETEVVVVTGHGDVDLVLSSLSLDAADFLDKPIRTEALAQALARCQERLDARREQGGQLQSRRLEGVTELVVRGRLSAPAEARLDALWREAALRGDSVLLDLDASVRLTGAGLALINKLALDCRTSGTRLAVAAATAEQRQLLDSGGVGRVADIHATQAEAMGALGVAD